MRKMMFAALSTLALLASPALAQQTTDTTTTPQAGQQRTDTQPGQRQAGRRQAGQRGPAMRASDLNGLEVRNAQNEEIGSIDDLVIDLQTGRVRYAALSAGGVLGIGDDLYAVPWSAFQMQISEEEDSYLILNVTEQQLENAPSFNQDNWPNMGDPRWRNTNDRYYSEQGITVRREGNRGRGGAAGRQDGVRPDGTRTDGPRTNRGNRSNTGDTNTGDVPERGDRQRTPGEAQNSGGAQNPGTRPQQNN